jgi:endoglucanase
MQGRYFLLTVLVVMGCTAAYRYPLSTKNATIVDADGTHVKLACVNWYGAHMERYVVDGLDVQPLEFIAGRIRSLGFNCVRLVYSLDLIYLNPVVSRTAISANPSLFGLKALDIFKKTVDALTSTGIMTILNNHISKAGWCCSTTDGEGLWWTAAYPEAKWLDHFNVFVKEFQPNPSVVGFDLRNEIRKTPSHLPTWGDGNNLTDWHRAATIAGNYIHSINPNLLIIVEGLDFATNLTLLGRIPVNLKTANKLIYSGHLYSWTWPVNWSKTSYEEFYATLHEVQTFVREKGIPFWMGEFGTNEDSVYWKYLIRYLKENNIDWAYWALNGYQGTPSKD